MLVNNITLHKGLSFEEYLKLPATSFSSLKGSVIEESYGMRIGSLVHKYILKPSEYNYEEYDVVAPLAGALIDYVGHGLIKNLFCEIPITASFEHEGFRLNWKGVPDMAERNVVVVDFKVIAGSLEDYCARFNYPNQLRGYMLPLNVDVGLIIAGNRLKPKQPPTIKVVNQDPRWWELVTISRGEIIK